MPEFLRESFGQRSYGMGPVFNDVVRGVIDLVEARFQDVEQGCVGA